MSSGPANTIRPETIDTLPLEKLFSSDEIRVKRKQVKESVIKFNKKCWKTRCKREGVEF